MDIKAEVVATVQDPERSKHNSLSKTSTLSQERSDGASQATTHAVSGARDSALLDDLKKDEATEKAVEVNESDDWATDPENARNWTALRKWTSMLVVGLVSEFSRQLFFHALNHCAGIVLYPHSAPR